MPKWPSLTLKFSSFWPADFGKMIIFHLHGQYAYQMKAEIILNSYLLSKSTILFEVFWKNLISKFFASIFEGKKNFDRKFFKKFYSQYYFLTANMNSECLELSFDMHIVHVGGKLSFFKNRHVKNSKISVSN